jgi:hypothetical protein
VKKQQSFAPNVKSNYQNPKLIVNMKIEIKKIQQTALLFEKVQKLYNEIAKVENLAQFVAENNVKGQLELSIGNSRPIQSSKITSDHLLDAHEAYMRRIFERSKSNFPPSGFFQQLSTEKPKKDDPNILLGELSETAIMQILGIILCEKQKKMILLMDKLKENGFCIEKE